MFESALLILGIGVGLVLALALAVAVFCLVSMGAIVILSYAAEQGFVGFVAYAAAWVFLFPFMLVASLIVGFIGVREQARLDRPYLERKKRIERETARAEAEDRRRAKLPPEKPPEDAVERFKWANRLPPCDN